MRARNPPRRDYVSIITSHFSSESPAAPVGIYWGVYEDQSEVRLSHHCSYPGPLLRHPDAGENEEGSRERTCYESSPSRTQTPEDEVAAGDSSWTSRWEGTSPVSSSSLSEK